MTLARTAPVIVSILIILAVAYLRDRSRTLAVIFGTMPVNLPLTLWITFGGIDDSQGAITDFVRSLLWALIATFLWLIVVWLIVRSGWGLLIAVASGYAAWGVLIVLLIRLGLLGVKH